MKLFFFLFASLAIGIFSAALFSVLVTGAETFRARSKYFDCIHNPAIRSQIVCSVLMTHFREKKAEHKRDRLFLVAAVLFLVALIKMKTWVIGPSEHGTLFFIHMIFVVLFSACLSTLFFYGGKKKYHVCLAIAMTTFACLMIGTGFTLVVRWLD